MISRSSLPSLFLLLLVAPSFAASDAPIEFLGRKLDLHAYLEGYPYSVPFVDLRTGWLFAKKKGVEDRLVAIPFDPAGADTVDLSKAAVVSPRDFSKRTMWGAFFDKASGKIILDVDENNDEVMNLYALDPKTGAEKKLTTTSYIFGYDRSPDDRLVALVTRSGKDELSPGDVRLLELATGRETVVYKDDPIDKLTWGAASWRPDGRGLIVSLDLSGDREKGNLLYVPLGEDAGAPRVVTSTSVKRDECEALNAWLDGDRFAYTSDEAGFTGVYAGSLAGGAPRLLTKAGENVKSAAVMEDGGRRYLAAVTGDPLHSVLRVADPDTGAVVFEKSYPGSLSIDETAKNKLMLTAGSLSNPFSDVEIVLSGGKAAERTRVAYPDALLKKIVACEPEKVSFETFDKLSAPGENGTLHGYLMKPRKPRTGDAARALVLSFYGGYNQWSTTFELLCDAGYYVLSPAPRGTEEFGKAFFDLASGDWGGAETLDDFAAGKFLAQKTGIPAKHVGIFGGSRGGYDTLRALTFPGQVNGVKEDFRFGFGISDFGIADIVRAAEGGNISQWYAQLTGGDPHKDLAKWRDRSPEAHADLISGPVLLTHGTADHRVPTAESRAMYAKLKGLGKEAYYVELAGQGHGYKGVEAQTKYYRAFFDFLAKIK